MEHTHVAIRKINWHYWDTQPNGKHYWRNLLRPYCKGRAAMSGSPDVFSLPKLHSWNFRAAIRRGISYHRLRFLNASSSKQCPAINGVGNNPLLYYHLVFSFLFRFSPFRFCPCRCNGSSFEPLRKHRRTRTEAGYCYGRMRAFLHSPVLIYIHRITLADFSFLILGRCAYGGVNGTVTTP